jgi:hypothetical protein
MSAPDVELAARVGALPVELRERIARDVARARAPRRVCPALLADVRTHALLGALVAHYADVFGTDECEHLHWLENNLLLFANWDVSLMEGVTDGLRALFPSLDDAQIVRRASAPVEGERALTRAVRRYWARLTPRRRWAFAASARPRGAWPPLGGGE